MCMSCESQCIRVAGYTLGSSAYVCDCTYQYKHTLAAVGYFAWIQMSLVCLLAKFQHVLEWGEELSSHVSMVAGGMVFSPIVG